MSNGGGGDGDGDGNGRRRKRDNQEEEEEAFMKDYPAGYKFKPTDEELIKYYLNPKIKKLPLPPNTIKDVNIYSYNPSDLTETYGSFYFFTPRERKNPNGNLPNRAANGGYWKTVKYNTLIIDDDTNEEIGYKQTLVFELGRPSKKNKVLRENQTGWHMHEYTLKKDKDEKNKCPSTEDGGHMLLDEIVLCKLYFKPLKTRRNRAVGAAAPPSIATTTTPSAAVPENHHQMHHYPLNSATAVKEIMPQNHHYMCRTDVAAADHRYPLTSMVLETAAPLEEMMPFNHHYYGEMMNQHQLQSVMLPSVNYNTHGQMNEQQLNHHTYGQMNQQQLQWAILPSVNHQHGGEMMNQQQLQSAVLPSVNHQHGGEMMNQQQLQSAVLPSINQHYYDEIYQQQLQPAVLPSVNHHHTYGQMNQQHLQPAALPSVNHPTDGQMAQEQLQDESDWAMLAAAWNNDTDFFLKLRERTEKQEQPTTTKKEKQITKEAG